MTKQEYTLSEDFYLESGQKLVNPKLVYHTAGTINSDGSNVVWVFHALTANSDVFDWWPGLFGEGHYYNPDDYFIICVNTLGSPYGSTSPTDFKFPLYRVRDVVGLQLKLTEHLRIERIHTLIGGSFGGYQALEFAYSYRGKVDNLISIASSAVASPWNVAIHESQRLAIHADVTFGKPQGGQAGLKAARAIGMLTYRTAESFISSQSDEPENWNTHRAAGYVDYQGHKLVGRFDALCYYYLTKCLDSHHIGRGRGGMAEALSQIAVNTLVISIDTDQLELPSTQREMAQRMPKVKHVTIHSDYGHDGFLIETESISNTIMSFIEDTMIKEITVAELAELQKNNGDYVLIDVREEAEVQIASIGGTLIPLGSVVEQKEKFRQNVEKVIVYCRSGKRSENAIDFIQGETGLENLYNLKGGILAYADEIDPSITKY